MNPRRCLAGGADNLLVALVPDQQDVVVLGREALGLAVHLGDQRAGGVDDVQPALGGLLPDLRRHAVRGKDNDRALGDLLGLLHEDRAAPLQLAHHVRVVHDLLADVYGRSVALQGLLDGLHRTVNPRAVAAGLREQDTSGGHDTHRR